ncbi:ATP-binding protein [Sulfuricurvum sp.]|uniref:ATP-binding protein n=1 Tax=Sulfuricurvum sp. TaxID=2025608 RepID=UPI003C388E3E
MKTIHERMRRDHLIDLLDHTDNLLSYVDTGYIYRAVNGAYSRRYQKDSDEIIGYHVSDILGIEVFETIVKPNLDRAFLGETLQYESWFDFPGLPRCYLIVTYNPRYHKDGTVEGVVVSAVDYTSLKIMEEEKQKQDEIVLEISKMAQIGEMISFISHQWRRPLNTIATYLLKIRRLIGANDSAIEAIQRCETLLDRLSSNLESMYALYARHSASEGADVQKSVEHVIALVGDRSEGLDIHIGIDIPEPLCVKCHTDELMHILLVIVENAIDSIAQSDEPIKYIRIDANRVDNDVLIDIKNNGDAISVEYSQRLFEPGFTTKPLSGQGYGLYFARKIVTEKLGGTIEIQPAEDGSWFRVTLPGHL